MNRTNYFKKSLRVVFSLAMVGYLIFAGSTFSQDAVSPSLKYAMDQTKVDARYFSPTASDLESLFMADNGRNGLPLQAGFSIHAGLTPANSGSIFEWPNGERSWMLKLVVPDAPALLLTFDEVYLPESGRIIIYAPGNAETVAVLTAKNLVSNTLSSPITAGGELVVEYVEAALGTSLEGTFRIDDVAFIANGLEAYRAKDLGESEACQVNINCPEGNNWQNQKRGVARILFREGSNNWFWCSGTLVNNTAQDGKPYFLTAEHCGGTASTADRNVWQFYFNYERPGCANTGTPPQNLITGCTLVAKGNLAGGSDFQLVELKSTPPQAWQPYYNGWSTNIIASTSGVSIHHPSGDSKKISTYTTALVSSAPNISGSQMAPNSAWRVTWSATETNHGVTEGGSSGSPIFNSDGLVVGTLSGGSSMCITPSYPDYYGKFSYHWQSNGTTNEMRLSPWLDPLGNNPTSLGGFDPYAGLFAEFSASKTQVYVGESVTFTDQSSGGEISSWAWNFGSGAVPATATGQGPHTVTYSTEGSKTVSLTLNGDIVKTKPNYITVLPSIFAAPFELEAEVRNGNNVRLTWNYPNLARNEGFESYENFVLSFPPWIQHDLDNRPSYSIQGVTFPNSGYRGSFIIFNHSAVGSTLGEAWAPHSGSKAAACFDAIPQGSVTANDDWLVSPRIRVLPGYTLKLWAKSVTSEYGMERLKVGISTTGSEPSNFTIISAGDYLQVPAAWTEYTYDLSAYAGNYIRFALNCVSSDAFALLIDDISVTDGAGKVIFSHDFEQEPELNATETRVIPTGVSPRANNNGGKDMSELSGYKVYRNDEVVATITNPDLVIYNDTNLSGGEYTYAVTATYSAPEGESAPSNSASVTIEGNSVIPNELESVSIYPNPFNQQINIEGAQRVKQVEVMNMLGQKALVLTHEGDESINIDTSGLSSGVYIISISTADGARRLVKMIKK